MQYAFYFDPSRCIECFAFEVACQAENDLRPFAEEDPLASGPKFREVVEVIDEQSHHHPVQYISMSCMHCGSPNCLTVCPTGAIYRDDERGLILVDQRKCIGCRYCSWACEFGAPQYDSKGLMFKCDMCVDRLDEGLEPACVQHCCGGAIKAGPVDELESDVRKRISRRLVSASRPNVFFATKE